MRGWGDLCGENILWTRQNIHLGRQEVNKRILGLNNPQRFCIFFFNQEKRKLEERRTNESDGVRKNERERQRNGQIPKTNFSSR